MSYLSFPRLDFYGQFRADPSTVNNTPDNYNPNNQFPPNEGEEIGKNIQLYWNPNGTGLFELDCKINKVSYPDGTTATSVDKESLIGQSVFSLNNTDFQGARVVDLDTMQQNVTELWGLNVGIGNVKTPLVSGAFKPSAYRNAWVPVIGGRGDYAGSAAYQSVLNLKNFDVGDSLFLKSIKEMTGELPQLSMNFTLRAYNSGSHHYLVNKETISEMNRQGIPVSETKKLLPMMNYMQSAKGRTGNIPGLIPTTSYFNKLLKSMLGKEKAKEYGDLIRSITVQKYVAATDFEFTYGQVFGSIGLQSANEPEFMTSNRMLTPTAIVKTSPPIKVPTDSGRYNGYFAPCKLNQIIDDGKLVSSWVTVNLGNSLPSTKPASSTNSYVDSASLGDLRLCCFPNGTNGKPHLLGKIDYQGINFYAQDSGIADVPIKKLDLSMVKHAPLGIVSVDENGEVKKIILEENTNGIYMRANQFVYRMNPGTESGSLNPGTAQVEFYATKFGEPLPNTEIEVSLMPSLESAEYSNNTLGTGGTTGMVNMGVPTSAVVLEGKTSVPVCVTTNADGIATLSIKSLNPGNPRGYMDGQIYFLKYRFADESIDSTYIQSPDALISLQIYEEQPAIEDVTWENFVQNVLGQYAKLYPIMSGIDMGNKASVIKWAKEIKAQLTTGIENGDYMPVTRDMSQSRLKLIVDWLDTVIPKSKSLQNK